MAVASVSRNCAAVGDDGDETCVRVWGGGGTMMRTGGEPTQADRWWASEILCAGAPMRVRVRAAGWLGDCVTW